MTTEEVTEILEPLKQQRPRSTEEKRKAAAIDYAIKATKFYNDWLRWRTEA